MACIANWREQVRALKEEKAKVEASYVKYQGRHQDLKKEKRTWGDIEVELLQRITELRAPMEKKEKEATK